MSPTPVLIEDPCPGAYQKILTIAHVQLSCAWRSAETRECQAVAQGSPLIATGYGRRVWGLQGYQAT